MALPERTPALADIDDPSLRPGRVAKWTGDLDEMIERGLIRVLTTADRLRHAGDATP